MNLKKPKFWDYKKPNIYSYLFLPITYLIRLLNLYKKIYQPKKFKIKTICVGNIYIGGTGKTSLSIKLNKLLREKNIKSCFVKKYYENQKDEQKLLEKNGKLFLSKNRVEAITQAENENYEIAILDDGLQDNNINYDTRIVCFNTANWIGNGMTIPSGPLRENISTLKEYKYVFLNGNINNLDNLRKFLININPNINIYLGIYEPTNLNEFDTNDEYLVFSGIGNHKTFIEMIKNYKIKIKKDIEFPDHFNYSNKDINNIITQAKNLNCKIMTTEKDYYRLEDKNLSEIKFIKSELKLIDEDKVLKSII